MRTIVTALVLFLLFAPALFAQGVPQSMNYQGYVTDLAGTPVADGNYSFTFALYTVESGGVALWTESHPVVAVNKGLFTVQLGRGNPQVPLTVSFDQQYFLGIRMNPDPEMTPRVRFATNAYSFRARTAEGVVPGSITDASVAAGAGIAASKLQSTVLTESEIVAGSGVTITPSGGTLTIAASPGAVTLAGDVTGPAASNTIANNVVTAAKIVPDIVSSLDGVSNDGGNIDLVAGSNITITPNDGANTITIAATGGGGGLTLPYDGTGSTTGAETFTFGITQTGTGRAAEFYNNNTSSAADVVRIRSNGTSEAIEALDIESAGGRAIEAKNNSATAHTIDIYNNGAGPVARFGNGSSSAADIVTISKSGGAGKGLNINYSGTTNAIFVDNNSTGTGIELKQDGTGKAAYFHIENTGSTENAVLAENKGTSTNADALQAKAAGGRALYGESAGSGATVFGKNTGSGRALWGENNSGSISTLAVSNSSASANAPIIQAAAGATEVFRVDREGDVDANGNIEADYLTARNNATGVPAAGRIYKDNIVYAWGRVASNGTVSGQSYGISSCTRNLADSSYTLTFSTTFSSVNDYAVVASPYAATNFEIINVSPLGTNTCKIFIRNLTVSPTNVIHRKYFDDFFVIVTGRP